jgi:hypothetical protein
MSKPRSEKELLAFALGFELFVGRRSSVLGPLSSVV